MPFTFRPLRLPEVILVEARAFGDARGYFLETYKRSAFATAGIDAEFVQDNCSHSVRGVLRGLHFQREPAAQGKLVQCVEGAILDVAVDVRRGSPSFGQWVQEELSEANHRMLYVPAGFAHGFYTLSTEAWVAYKVTAEYSEQHDGGIRWDDPEVGVAWPEGERIVSSRDATLPYLAQAELNFSYARPR